MWTTRFGHCGLSVLFLVSLLLVGSGCNRQVFGRNLSRTRTVTKIRVPPPVSQYPLAEARLPSPQMMQTQLELARLARPQPMHGGTALRLPSPAKHPSPSQQAVQQWAAQQRTAQQQAAQLFAQMAKNQAIQAQLRNQLARQKLDQFEVSRAEISVTLLVRDAPTEQAIRRIRQINTIVVPARLPWQSPNPAETYLQARIADPRHRVVILIGHVENGYLHVGTHGKISLGNVARLEKLLDKRVIVFGCHAGEFGVTGPTHLINSLDVARTLAVQLPTAKSAGDVVRAFSSPRFRMGLSSTFVEGTVFTRERYGSVWLVLAAGTTAVSLKGDVFRDRKP